MSADYSRSESGERVIAESRRPDGTVRKERRVRAGYVPQEEQQVYVSRGAAFKASVPKCPGFEETSTAAAPAKPKTKSAAKNAKRKEKRVTDPAPNGGGGAASNAAATALQNLSLGGGSSSGAAQAQQTAAAPAAAADEEPSTEKQIRTLKKKMRQAEALAEKQGLGQALSPEEQAKLSRLAAWQEELRQLEALS
ncbi:Partner of Y14 and mago [Chlorella vulgaris]